LVALLGTPSYRLRIHHQESGLELNQRFPAGMAAQQAAALFMILSFKNVRLDFLFFEIRVDKILCLLQRLFPVRVFVEKRLFGDAVNFGDGLISVDVRKYARQWVALGL
jgi:hypothetical protein